MLSTQQHAALRVTAHLGGRSLVALDSMWPLLLDGLLAGVVDGRRGGGQPMTHRLPLRQRTAGAAAQWSWLASVATPVDPEPADVWAYRWREEPRPLTVRCSALWWHCAGHADLVAELLAEVGSVGNRHHAAPVARWEVTPLPLGVDQHAELIWLPTGYIARPVAARCAESLGVTGAETVEGAVRPPYWRAPATNEGGTWRREWRPVLAPWTRRP